MTEDTANEVAPLDELLKTTRNRVNIALFLLERGKWDELPTILEDIFGGAQLIIDNYCIKGEGD